MECGSSISKARESIPSTHTNTRHLSKFLQLPHKSLYTFCAWWGDSAWSAARSGTGVEKALTTQLSISFPPILPTPSLGSYNKRGRI